MEHSNRRFTPSELALLKRAKGSKLLSIDAVLAAPPDNSYNTVRLHFDDFDIDVNDLLNDIVIDELGTIEEFGLLSVTEASKEVLDVPDVSVDTTVFEVGETIKGVTVINAVAEIYGNDIQVARLEYPQAVAFETGDGYIMLDKEVWFSELIVVKRGSDIEDLLYDDSVNWDCDPMEDPTTRYEFHTEVQEL